MGRRFKDLVDRREDVRPWWWHESKWARRVSNRKVRHTANVRVHQGSYDDLPRPPRTEGWITW